MNLRIETSKGGKNATEIGWSLSFLIATCSFMWILILDLRLLND